MRPKASQLLSPWGATCLSVGASGTRLKPQHNPFRRPNTLFFAGRAATILPPELYNASPIGVFRADACCCFTRVCPCSSKRSDQVASNRSHLADPAVTHGQQQQRHNRRPARCNKTLQQVARFALFVRRCHKSVFDNGLLRECLFRGRRGQFMDIHGARHVPLHTNQTFLVGRVAQPQQGC